MARRKLRITQDPYLGVADLGVKVRSLRLEVILWGGMQRTQALSRRTRAQDMSLSSYPEPDHVGPLGVGVDVHLRFPRIRQCEDGRHPGQGRVTFTTPFLTAVVISSLEDPDPPVPRNDAVSVLRAQHLHLLPIHAPWKTRKTGLSSLVLSCSLT